MTNEVIEADKLKQIISKIETIEEERAEFADLLKDAFNKAKSMGFDVKIIKHVPKTLAQSKLSDLVKAVNEGRKEDEERIFSEISGYFNG